MRGRLAEGDLFLREIVSKGKVLYEAHRRLGAEGRGRRSRTDDHASIALSADRNLLFAVLAQPRLRHARATAFLRSADPSANVYAEEITKTVRGKHVDDNSCRSRAATGRCTGGQSHCRIPPCA